MFVWGLKIHSCFSSASFLACPNRCSLVLLIGADWFSHHSLNLTCAPPPPPPLLPLPINYNKIRNGWQPKLAKGRQNKDRHTIECRIFEYMYVVTSAKEVMFSPLSLYLLVCLFFSKITERNCADFLKSLWKDAVWVTEEPLNFGLDPGFSLAAQDGEFFPQHFPREIINGS